MIISTSSSCTRLSRSVEEGDDADDPAGQPDGQRRQADGAQLHRTAPDAVVQQSILDDGPKCSAAQSEESWSAFSDEKHAVTPE